MTEQQKRAAIASLMERALAAEKRGLFHTAKSFRDQAFEIGSQPADADAERQINRGAP